MKTDDWELKVAFIRLDFPPDQRDLAQTIAAAFAEVSGTAILQLRPEHTMGEIMSWRSESASLDVVELIMALEEILGHEIDDDFADGFEKRTFREFIEYLSRRVRVR